ncbi:MULTISPECIES: PD-(D/E)XK nuclease family protein [Morganellaceae]|uniref:PDDEXK-like family protein n=1 Tax=Morganellaceae TaxID=1903414 RepID=UPI0020245347|nr:MULTISPECIES: PD-(D/E)XK nuclease family protein [Morganellaceae]MCL8621702.1 PD-(D/E)XK nuclease family protein [Proteus mirabilis]MCL8632824.1 PD-(D/E)XK nuclease family protein [Proteus mirabilis]HCT3785150.1 PD-(D/E)XK nuclease family protein [Proteus mirabilis]
MEQINLALTTWLDNFFRQWPQDIEWSEEAKKPLNIDASQLTEFFSLLAEPLFAVQHPSLQFNPWEIAGLQRKEVPNTSVLAWLLNPYASHGFGKLPLQVLLRLIRSKNRHDIPADFNRFCHIETETNPVGDDTNRVDIEISADNFFLLIEVKIDAGEQDQQIARYCIDAKIRAANRPWAVIFLTPQGRRPLTGNPELTLESVPCLSWRQLAADLESSLLLYHNQCIATGNISPMQDMASYAVFCFLEHIRTF